MQRGKTFSFVMLSEHSTKNNFHRLKHWTFSVLTLVSIHLAIRPKTFYCFHTLYLIQLKLGLEILMWTNAYHFRVMLQ